MSDANMTKEETIKWYEGELRMQKRIHLDVVNTLKEQIREAVGRASLNTRTFIEKEKRGSALISLDDLDNKLNKLTEVHNV
jgi:hypothetical protein